MAVRTPYGRVFARHVALGTNAFPSLVKRVRPYIVPVYDHALMTEPLTEQQLAAIGWKNRQGLSDSNNHFHYFRITADNRILWGGYDIVYRYGGGVRAEYDQHPATYEKLARHFFRCFPQLEGLRFSHTWGGAIDTCSRFSAFFGTAHAGRVAYAAGYTGLGVGATRFGAEVMLDLLGRRAHRAHRAGDGPQQAAAVPAGAAALGRHRHHPVVDDPGRHPRRTPQPVAEGHGQGGPGLRQLTLNGGRVNGSCLPLVPQCG